jgi:hypothetical protein
MNQKELKPEADVLNQHEARAAASKWLSAEVSVFRAA